MRKRVMSWNGPKKSDAKLYNKKMAKIAEEETEIRARLERRSQIYPQEYFQKVNN